MISFLEVFLSYTLIPYIFGGCKRSFYVNFRKAYIKIIGQNIEKNRAREVSTELKLTHNATQN